MKDAKIIKEISGEDPGDEFSEVITFVYKWRDGQGKVHAVFSQAGKELIENNYTEN
jgi:hypothetical protein